MTDAAHPSSSSPQDEGLRRSLSPSYVLNRSGGPCGIRPTVTGPTWRSVLQAYFVISFSVITVCNPPLWEYSGDNPGARGHKRPYIEAIGNRRLL
jgi:hypothetical protein